MSRIPPLIKVQFQKALFRKWRGLNAIRFYSCDQNSESQVTNSPSPEPGNKSQFRHKLLSGPNLRDFFKDEHLQPQDHLAEEEVIPYLKETHWSAEPDIPYLKEPHRSAEAARKVYFDVYGCQMNVNDTEIVWSILKSKNYERTTNIVEADVILIMTCAIRDSAEERIWQRLQTLRGVKKQRMKYRPILKIGILGCMAERLKEKVLERDRIVDLVAGPDSYRDLPRLLSITPKNNYKSINVMLSFDETYADITPVRLNEDSITAFVSIMRGCDNMCTYCIVPFTRGRERSRPVKSILHEIEHLSKQGIKEVTLLGQNVNSYRDISEGDKDALTHLAKGFKTVYKSKKGGLRFADLLDQVANVNPEMRIRFTSPHPKDFPDEVIDVVQSHSNICKILHIPAQSGNSAVLERMRRGYTRESYLELIELIRKRIPDVALSSDFICGFCGETDAEFDDTLSLMEEVKYNVAYMFPYSMREKTTAHRRFRDDVSPEIKQERLVRMINLFRQHALTLNLTQIGKTHLVLVEGYSKRSAQFFQGRNDYGTKVIFPADDHITHADGTCSRLLAPGDYVAVHINSATSQVLKGMPLYHTSLQEFFDTQHVNTATYSV